MITGNQLEGITVNNMQINHLTNTDIDGVDVVAGLQQLQIDVPAGFNQVNTQLQQQATKEAADVSNL